MLKKKGYDVYVEGVDAYSTSGWSEDPVLSTFVDYSETALAATLFHELAHQRIYLSGDTEFNEAFAVAVEREGVQRWLADQDRPGALDAYQTGLQRQEEFVDLILQTREKLESLYERNTGTEGRKRKRKSQIISQLREDYRQFKQRWNGYSGYDWWFERPLNNAQLNTIGTYYRLVPAFERLLAEAGGDLPQFYREILRLSRLSKTERHQFLETLLPARS
jgi:predicted aminopeptidase